MSITIIAIVRYVIGAVELTYWSYAAAKARYRSRAKSIMLTVMCAIGWPIVETIEVVMGVANRIMKKKD